MRYSAGKQFIAIITVIMMLLSSASPALAAVHPLSRLDHNSTSGVSDIDVTISLDWDPARYVNPAIMSKQWLENAVTDYAASLYAMTNGLHRLRNVYIYKNKKFWSSADIRYVSTKADRSAANVAGWRTRNKEIIMYVYEEPGKVDTNPGQVMAHESGHYIYGLWDEYREDASSGGKTIEELTDAGQTWKPSSEDFQTHPSIMNEHAVYHNWFSTNETYSGSADRLNTAHYRIYKKSIWDTLTSDPQNDPEIARDENRMWFEAFKNKRVKAKADLKINNNAVPQKGSVSGYNGALNIVWADDTPVLNMVVLDTNIPADSWEEALNGAAELPKKIPVGSALQVISGSSNALGSTTVTVDNRNTLVSNLKKIAPAAQVTVEVALWTAVDQIKKYYNSDKPSQTTKLVLIAATNPVVSDELLLALQQCGASVDVFLLKSRLSAAKASARPAPAAVKASEGQGFAGRQVYLSQLAQQTGGSFSTVTTESELEHAVQSAALEDEEIVMSSISDLQASSLAAKKSLTMQIPVGAYDTVPMIMVEVPSADNFTLNITGPKGETLTPLADPDGKGWIYAINTETTGTGAYTATLTAKEAMNGAIYMVAYSFSSADETPLLMQMNVLQRPVSGNLLEVSLKLDRPVVQAHVQAIVSDEDGKEVLRLTAVDNGTNGDRRADDGIYTASLRDLKPGEYSFRVVANDNSGKAVASDRGLFFNPGKASTPDEPTGTFQRTDEQSFAVATFTAPTGGGGGGGCAVGAASSGDLLLTLSIILPLLYLVLSRRREENP